MYITTRVSLLIIMAAILAPNVAAQQWTRTGDSDLRRDVELLKAYDIIDGPVNTWPLSWKQITSGISANEAASYPAYVMRAIERTKAKSPNKEWRFASDLRLANEPMLVRGFGDAVRSDADITLSAAYQSSKLDANLGVNFRDGHNGSDVNLDGSYIATSLGNWSLYGGAIDRWWGPGQDNTLMLSSNARPMASIGLRRNAPEAFQTKWLSWLGPWTWDMFVAHMGKDRHIPNAVMAGMRFGFEPFNGFEVGLSRSMQLCGDNRPCDFNNWMKALIAFGDLDNTKVGIEEPGNQLASIDFAYSHQFGNKSLRAYLSGTAEDQNVIMPFQYARLLGVTLTSPIGDQGNMLSLNSEWSDSGDVLAWFFGKRQAGTMYNHSIYATGHRYDGRSIGHSLDNDSKLISLTTTLTRAGGDSYRLSLKAATINWDDNSNNIISLTPQKYKSIEASAAKQFEFGHVEAKISLQTKVNTLTQGLLPRFTAGVVWRKEF